MKIQDAVVLVTGGSRGLGKALVDEVLARAPARSTPPPATRRTVTNPDVVPLPLEVTDPASVAAAAAQARDVTILINNAGVHAWRTLTSRGDLEEVRREFETNFYGPLQRDPGLRPAHRRNGGGHLLNIHSALSWIALGRRYSASKAALWSQTNALRLELAPAGIGRHRPARRLRRHRHGDAGRSTRPGRPRRRGPAGHRRHRGGRCTRCSPTR